MSLKIGTDEEKLSTYYPYSLVQGRSIHIEQTPDGDYSVWDSHRIAQNLTHDEAITLSQYLHMQNTDNESNKEKC